MTIPSVPIPAFLALLALAVVVGAGAVLSRRSMRRRLDETRLVISRLDRRHQAILEALILALDARDPASRGHVHRVRAYAVALARRLEMGPSDEQAVTLAALLHDVGKVGLPDHILCKPGRLSEVEYERVKRHPEAGAAILEPAGLPAPVVDIIRHHHERWDGTGYPDRLRGAAIPAGARVLAVADAFESLTHGRAYRSRMTAGEALAVLETWAGVHFDPEVVRALRDGLEEVVAAPEASPPPAAPAAAPARPADAGGFGDTLHQGIAPPPAPDPSEAPRALPASPGVVPDARAARREVFTLYEIAQTLGSTLRLDDVLDLVVSRVAQMVPFRTCAVWLADRESGDLSACFVAGAYAGALRGRSVRPGQGITGWAAAQRSTRFSGEAAADLGPLGIDPAGYSTVAAFPLCHKEAVYGVITLYFPAGIVCLDDHIRVMEVIARLTAGAVADGRLNAPPEAGSLADEITHLPNRRYLRQVFEQETLRSQQSGQPLAFLQMDLEQFGTINERFGVAAGDRFLMEIGRVLKSHLRERDVLVRADEDGFEALLPGSGFAAAALLAERLQRAADAFSLRFEESGPAVRVGLSVGIAIYPLDGEHIEDLAERAAANRLRNRLQRRIAREATPNVVPFRVPG